MAKVNEILKANSICEMNLDEIDKVVGGECRNAADIKTEEDLHFYVYEFIAALEQSWGKEVAAAFVEAQFPDPFLRSDYLHGSLDTLYTKLGEIFLR